MATTVNWGVVSELGYVARHPEIGEFLAREGYLSMTPAQLTDVLAELLRREAIHVMAARVDWRQLDAFAPRFTSTNRIRHLVPARAGPNSKHSLLAQLLNEDPANRHRLLEQFLADQLGRLLGTASHSVEVERPLNELGLDSLIATELTVVIGRDLGIDVPATQLLGVANLRAMTSLVLKLLCLQSAGPLSKASVDGTSAIRESPRSVPLDRERMNGPVPAAASELDTANNGLAVNQKPPATLTRQNGPSAPTSRLSPGNGRISRPSSRDAVDHRTLDYSRWSTSQSIVKVVARTCFGVLARVSSEGFEHIPQDGPCILAVNHLSMLDVPLLLSLLSRRTVILAHDKLRESRFLNFFLADLGQTIFVRRNELDDESLRRALSVLEAGGMLALAPEGQRSKGRSLLKGKTGVAYLATRANAPVIPVVAWGQETWRQLYTSGRRMQICVRVESALHFSSEDVPADMLGAAPTG